MKYKIIVTTISACLIVLIFYQYNLSKEKNKEILNTFNENQAEINILKYALKEAIIEVEYKIKIESDLKLYDFINPIHHEDYIRPTSPYGIREVPKGIFTGGSRTRKHYAWDAIGTWKARIVAVQDGVVKDKWYVPDGKRRKGHKLFGGYIVILHDDGSESAYAHLSWINNIKEGMRVKQGQVIGRQGSSGLSDGEHLHFILKIKGILVNPLQYIRIGGINE